MVDKQLLKRCLEVLLADSIRSLYEKLAERSGDDADIRNAISEREKLLEELLSSNLE